MAQIIDLGKIRFNWAGTYSGATEYSYNDLVKYGPNLYAFTATSAATGVVPTNTGSWAKVVEGIDYRGTYTNGTLYYLNDIVIDGTNTYITLTQHTATSSVALGNANLEIIALGQEGLPNQTGNTNKVLTTDGTETQWSATTYLTKSYTGNAQGQGAFNFETAAELTDSVGVFSQTSADFVQLPLVNTSNGANASTDFIAYTADGTNDSGWIDMGITSNNFNAETFGITGPHDGYIFMSAPRTTRFDVVSTAIAGGFATITTGSGHGFSIGNEIRIEEVNATFNGIHTITAVPSPTSFRFATLAAPQSEVELDPFGVVYKPTGDGNLVFATDETGLQNKIIFAAGGFSSGLTQMSITPDENVHIEIATPSTSATTGALTVVGGVGISGDLYIAGNFDVNGQLDFSGVDVLPVGPGAGTFAGTLTNPTIVVKTNDNDYAQVAFQNANAGADASTDFIAYADNGTDDAGYIDMGITSSAFADPGFTITGENDGYIFMVAPEGTTGNGDLVLATGDTGALNRIVFAAGGLASDNTQMSIIPDDRVHIEIDSPSTSPTTGALTVVGGVGIQGDMNIQGDVSIEGTITFGGAGTTVETSNLAVTDPLIFTGSGNQADISDLGLITEHTVSVSPITATISNKALTSNIATLTTSSAHGYRAGDVVVVTGVDATFNGTFSIIDVPLTTTFTYAKTATNVVSASATGSASVSARRVFDGMVRDASDGVVKFFTGAVTKPTSTVNFAEAGLTYGNLQANNATLGGTLVVTGTATVATPTTSGHATTKAYADTETTNAIKTAVGSGADYAYDVDNRVTAYKVSPSKRYTGITYNEDGYVSGYTEVITIDGTSTTTAYTVTVDANGNITAITAA